jgi:hypothetical protein
MDKGWSNLALSLYAASFKPESKHQDVPKLPGAIAQAGLMIVPNSVDERAGKKWIFAIDDMSTGKIVNPTSKPLRQWNTETHFSTIDDFIGQAPPQSLFENVLAGLTPDLEASRHRRR